MSIDRDIILHTADLARLDMQSASDEEIEAMQSQLNKILSYVDKLAELDTDGVPPTTHAVPIHLALRVDETEPVPGAERILANAPEAEAGFFVVPRVISEG
ncbi:MAG: Asp-tRNA(Asn)/Glu-tRNA(Gln) amidotransferase subunit GatC [Myxococcales bacterium]|nr:Asp-tRNA(Asn)/Glu-tRNA(Gln) amidotransferase subunit GatC [Myxococcales bacterium]